STLPLLCSRSRPHRHLHSFPTRRSSDLVPDPAHGGRLAVAERSSPRLPGPCRGRRGPAGPGAGAGAHGRALGDAAGDRRGTRGTRDRERGAPLTYDLTVDTFLAIASKRDTRRYAERPIPADVADRILQAGRVAGSARNR